MGQVVSNLHDHHTIDAKTYFFSLNTNNTWLRVTPHNWLQAISCAGNTLVIRHEQQATKLTLIREWSKQNRWGGLKQCDTKRRTRSLSGGRPCYLSECRLCRFSGVGHAISVYVGHAISVSVGHAVSVGVGHAISVNVGHAISVSVGHAVSVGVGHAISVNIGHAVSVAGGHAV